MGRTGQAKDSITTFGEMLKHLRRRAQLTQRELSMAVGYSESQITRLESGQRLPDPVTVEAQFIDALQLDHDTAIQLITLAKAAVANASLPAGASHAPAPASSEMAHPGIDQEAPAQPPYPHGHTNLPAQLTHFIGREHEVGEVAAYIQACRLVTLTGSGGVGKTRMAIEVGSNLLNLYHDGVWLVELAPLNDPVPLPNTIAAVFGLPTMSRPALTALTEHLLDRHVLLILDNCEHLINACANLVTALLQACPHLHVLATSREALNIPGEVAWRVPPLAMDIAVQLFVERACAVKPSFAVTTTNRRWIAHICQRLDYMPLAIELAAARMRTFSVEELAERMDDVFRLLTGGSRTALPRQQTLRATIKWSYDLLPEHERALLHGLSVFAGGWTLETAEAVLGDGVLEQLDQLVNKSLVIAAIDEATGTMRYRLLEVIRQYASEAATSTDAAKARLYAIRQRHLKFFADFAQSGRLNILDETWHWVWNASLAAELDNTRAALAWAAQSGDWQLGWQLTTGILGVWTVLGYGDELIRWSDANVLSNPKVSDIQRGHSLTVIGRLCYTKGDVPESIARYRAASELAHRIEDEELILEADQYLGFLTLDDDISIRLLNAVIALAHQTERKSRESLALSMLGARLRLQGNLNRAHSALTESVRLARKTGNSCAIAGALGPMGRLLLEQGNYPEARAVLEESILLNRQEGLRGWLGYDLENLAEVGLGQGDGALVKRLLPEIIPYYHQIDDLGRVARGLTAAAGLAQLRGQLAPAVRLLGAASAIRREHHTHGIFESDMSAEYNRRLPALRAVLAQADFETAWAEGQALSLHQAIALALTA